MLTIILATQNKNKVKEMENILNSSGINANVISANELGIIEAPQETGSTFSENALIKAEAVFKKIKENNSVTSPYVVLADDSGIAVDALNGKPGVYSARYASIDGQDAKDGDNVRKLLQDVKDVPPEKRNASFVCVISVITDTNKVFESIGTLNGKLAYEPVGENGFGYDPILFIPSENCTVAQMGDDRKNMISHRSKAIKNAVELIMQEYCLGENL